MASPHLPHALRYTFKDFERDFPNDEACMRWIVEHLYSGGIRCRKCKRVTKHHYLKNRKGLSCDTCGAHVHPTAGTIFHKSSTPLRVWFHALFLMSATRCGISAMQLMRETGTTYKTAWRMFNKIRGMLHEDIRDLGGPGRQVEADETFIGGRRRLNKMHKASIWENKAVVGGIVERKGHGGRVHAYVASRRGFFELTMPIRERVLPETMIFTDETPLYGPLSKVNRGYQHKRIHHEARVYVRGDVHTNTIEGFWSLVKRGISGVYHSVSKKHLQGYLDEYSFRYNHRSDPWPMFQAVSRRIQSPVASLHQPDGPRYLPRPDRDDESPS